MLSNIHFYHRTTRSLVTVFGTLFNNIRLVRYNNEGTAEIERVTVPISYSSKEKFYKRITEDPTLANETQINLPRFAFEMAGMTYDSLRKTSSHNNVFYSIPNNGVNRLKKVPYNLDFNLHLFVRNIEEGFQLIEQIIPVFDPDYTVTMDFVDIGDIKLDVPIVLNGITYDDSNEGAPTQTRVLSWTLNFTAKAYYLSDAKNTKIITNSRGNVYTLSSDIFNLNLGNGVDYTKNELVYQGPTLDEATAVGYVRAWSNLTNTISLSDVSGQFKANSILVGSHSGAKYNLNTAPIEDQLLEIKVEPDPLTANVTDDFAYTTTITRGPF